MKKKKSMRGKIIISLLSIIICSFKFGKDESSNKESPNLDIEWVEEIASTQHAVKANSLLLAECQHAGVGRRGKSWLTPPAKSICFSYRFELNCSFEKVSGYALCVAVSIIQTMHSFDPITKLK